MKAVRKLKPEFGATMENIDIPKDLAPGWVLIKVRATSICGTDVHIWNWDPWSQGRIGEKRLPQTLGHEFAGEVVEVGPYCQRIKVGDYVSGETHIYDPGDLTSMLGILHVGKNMKILGVDTNGCFAEYVQVPEIVLWKNEKSVAPELATIQEPLGNACYAVMGEDNDVYGKTMLITGDGPISLFAIQVAKLAGISKIINFGKYEFNMNLGKKLGADFQLNTANTTAAQRLEYVMDHTDGYGVDIALEMVGTQDSIDDCFKMIRKGGRLTAFGIAPTSPCPVDYNNGIVFKGVQVHGINGRKIFDTWYRNGQMLAMGKLDPTPVITHVFTLDDYAKGFAAMTDRPRVAAKVVLFPDKAEYEAAVARRK